MLFVNFSFARRLNLQEELTFNAPTSSAIIILLFEYDNHLIVFSTFELFLFTHGLTIFLKMSYLLKIKVSDCDKQKALPHYFDVRIYNSFSYFQIFISFQIPKSFFTSNQILFSFFYQLKIFNLELKSPKITLLFVYDNHLIDFPTFGLLLSVHGLTIFRTMSCLLKIKVSNCYKQKHFQVLFLMFEYITRFPRLNSLSLPKFLNHSSPQIKFCFPFSTNLKFSTLNTTSL
jgi:hypothetical protein